MRAFLAMAALLASVLPALAHGAAAHDPVWTFAPLVTVPLALSGGLYALGLTRLWRHAGLSRGVRLWQASSFALGWLLLIAALLSPLHWLGGHLFTAHMFEHEILMALSAPLIVVARPIGAMLWGLPPGARRAFGAVGRAQPLARLWGWLIEPLTATVLHGIALWAWHMPMLYDQALASSLVHWLQHVSFLATAVLFWWSILRGRTRQRGYGPAVFYLFATALHSGFLGVLLLIAREPVYAAGQTSAAAEWGLTALEDQQLAGLLMWVPAGLVYAVAALACAGLWIAHSGSRAMRGGTHAVGAS